MAITIITCKEHFYNLLLCPLPGNRSELLEISLLRRERVREKIFLFRIIGCFHGSIKFFLVFRCVIEFWRKKKKREKGVDVREETVVMMEA